jgi:hypothetical protein
MSVKVCIHHKADSNENFGHIFFNEQVGLSFSSRNFSSHSFDLPCNQEFAETYLSSHVTFLQYPTLFAVTKSFQNSFTYTENISEK